MSELLQVPADLPFALFVGTYSGEWGFFEGPALGVAINDLEFSGKAGAEDLGAVLPDP